MAKYFGATDAFNAIVQKVDETLIQAESHLRNLHEDTVGAKPSDSLPDRTIVPSPSSQSERSCSPEPRIVAPQLSAYSGSSAASSSSVNHIDVKSKSYLALDKKKALIMTSLKSKRVMNDSDVTKVQKLIDDLFGKQTSSSSSSMSILQL